MFRTARIAPLHEQEGRGRRGRAILAALVLCAAFCGGCADMQQIPHASDDSPPANVFHFRDGGEAIFFAFVNGIDYAGRDPDTYVFAFSGSGCASMKYSLPRYFRGLEGDSGPIRIFVLHKRFIEEWTWGRIWGCSDAFVEADHPSQWLADYSEFIEAKLAERRPRRVVLLGISEGAEVIPWLAQRVAGVTHVVLVASGGMDPLDAYRMQAEKHRSADDLNIVAAVERGATDEEGNGAKRIGGRTWRYWLELRELKPTERLLELTVPILVGMGEADSLMPIETAWYVRDRFRELGKTNLTILTYPGADHSLFVRDSRVFRMPDFLHAMDLWLMQ